jgi:hypothetical protein
MASSPWPRFRDHPSRRRSLQKKPVHKRYKHVEPRDSHETNSKKFVKNMINTREREAEDGFHLEVLHVHYADNTATIAIETDE